MKFSQLIKHNMRKIFYEKSYEKYGGGTIPRLFLKNQTWVYLWINSLKFIQFAFIVWQVEGYIYWN